MVSVNAPAKINLGLQILGKREDGFHDLISIFQTIDLYDCLTFKPASAGETIFSCSDRALPQGKDNLVCRAVDIFREATGIEEGIEIHLKKHIPYGAGLGGGSSDAASVLLALNDLWCTEFDIKKLQDLGLQLGSDVPFFMQKGTALVQGRGERLCYIPWRADVYYVLVAPTFEVATGWAYANYKKALTGNGGYANFLNSVNPDEMGAFDLLRHLENDFLPLILQTHPEVGSILQKLEDYGAVATSLSGSGSTLYGVFKEKREAQEACSAFEKGGNRVFLCCPLLA